jgi:hypothetical protein
MYQLKGMMISGMHLVDPSPDHRRAISGIRHSAGSKDTFGWPHSSAAGHGVNRVAIFSSLMAENQPGMARYFSYPGNCKTRNDLRNFGFMGSTLAGSHNVPHYSHIERPGEKVLTIIANPNR